MTADLVVLTAPGRLGELARLRRLTPLRSCLGVADYLQVTAVVARIRQVIEEETGPLRVTPVHVLATPPADAQARLRAIGTDARRDRTHGIDDDVLASVAADLAVNPRRWLVQGVASTLTAQCEHKARWS